MSRVKLTFNEVLDKLANLGPNAVSVASYPNGLAQVTIHLESLEDAWSVQDCLIALAEYSKARAAVKAEPSKYKAMNDASRVAREILGSNQHE